MIYFLGKKIIPGLEIFLKFDQWIKFELFINNFCTFTVEVGYNQIYLFN